MKIIDGQDLVLGRMASRVAEFLLSGEEVVVLNAEDVVITGRKESIFEEYKARRDRGHRYQGPFYPREPHMIVKRTIRGMIPWKKSRGKEAYRRLKIHLGVPEEFSGKGETLERCKVNKEGRAKFITVGEVAQHLGWKPRM